MAEHTARLEAIERRLSRAVTAVPYVLLAVSAALSLLTGEDPVDENVVNLGLTLVTVVWMAAWEWRDRAGAVYVSGLICMIAVLGYRDFWYAGFFAFTGYLHSWRYLSGSWRIVGVAATAAVSMTAFMRAFVEPTPEAVLVGVVIVAAIVVLVSLFSLFGDVTAERSAERTAMVERLEDTLRENEALQARLLRQAREAGALDERQRMAREIHDTLAQSFAGIITQLSASAQARASGDAVEAERHLALGTALAREGLDEARRSVHAFAPKALEDACLPDALRDVVDRWSDRTGIRGDMVVTGEPSVLAPEVEAAVLRVVQEALTNTAKHASASRAGVTLSYMGDVVTVDVRDDGGGFDVSAPANGFGLTSMRQRASQLEGAIEIESEPGAGTAVSATLPATPSESA